MNHSSRVRVTAEPALLGLLGFFLTFANWAWAAQLPSVDFNPRRGFYGDAVLVTLTTSTVGATIRYTTDGSQPTATRGTIYRQPVSIDQTTVLRAAAFKEGSVPSSVKSHTYLIATVPSIRSLPVLSIGTDPTNLVGATGIEGIQGGRYVFRAGDYRWEPVAPGDYHNPSKTGIDWERPCSAEWVPLAGEDFHINCGIRVHGSDLFRSTYKPESKFSYRLYFRDEYGEKKLRYPLFSKSAVTQFDHLVVRGGHNDYTNPFVTDELVRRLGLDTGHIESHGTFANLFVNARYRGYYNLTERIDTEFMRAWHGGTNEWDVIGPYDEVKDGDDRAWWSFKNFFLSKDFSSQTNYQLLANRLDLTNFVDYLLVNIYADTHDWSDNNWRAARERTSNAKFRFYIWDAEFSMGIYEQPVTNNTLTDPLELANQSDISELLRRLRQNPEFTLLFADRVQKHFFNGGALTRENVLRHYRELRDGVAGVIPNFKNYIETIWAPQRGDIVLNFLTEAGLARSGTAPVVSPFGGSVAGRVQVTLSAPEGTIYYTTNGQDPRVAFTGAISPQAQAYQAGKPIFVGPSTTLKARGVSAGWSALVETIFQSSAGQQDSDGDGLPDDWERSYGLNPQDASDAMGDPDLDGLTNYQEFGAGTNPLDGESTLKLALSRGDDGRLFLRWMAAPAKNYVIETRELRGTEWVTLVEISASAAETEEFEVVPDGSDRIYRLVAR